MPQKTNKATINLGLVYNTADFVEIKFEKPPTKEVVKFLNSLETAFNWEVAKKNRTEFTIKAIGKNALAGNAIAHTLTNKHSLEVSLWQYARDSSGVRQFQEVKKLDLSLDTFGGANPGNFASTVVV